MISFKKDKYFMIDEKFLNKDESIKFIACLEIERKRHKESLKDCLIDMDIINNLANIEYIFWFSSYKRHIQDVEMIDKSIKYLRLKWNLND